MLVTVALHRVNGKEVISPFSDFIQYLSKVGSKAFVFSIYLIFSLICAAAHPISTKLCYHWGSFLFSQFHSLFLPLQFMPSSAYVNML